MELQEHRDNLTIVHRAGRKHLNADSLSRWPRVSTESATVLNVRNDLKERLLLELLKDSFALDVFEKIDIGNKSPKILRFEKIGELLYFKDPVDKRYRLYIPAAMKADILYEFHDTPMAGHCGGARMYARIAAQFYWPRMQRDIKKYAASCISCQKNKPRNRMKFGLLDPLDIPEGPFDTVSMDFITKLPISPYGNDSIMVIVDKCTKCGIFIPLKEASTAEDIADLFFKYVFRHHGLPLKIICDRDPKFTSAFWKQLFKRMETKIGMSTAYHPQSDGQTEILNRILIQMLRHFVDYQQVEWDDLLPIMEFAYNATPHTATGFSPFLLNTGREPRVPASLLCGGSNEEKYESVKTFLENMAATLRMAQENIGRAQDMQAKYYNKHRMEANFNIGDLVYLSTEHYKSVAEANRPSSKLCSKFMGPFKIIDRIHKNAYKLDLPPHFKFHNVVNVEYLRKHIESELEIRKEVLPTVELYIDPEEEEYNVEKILKHRGSGKAKQYLVKWKDYPLHDATWEPAAELKRNCANLIKYYEKDMKDRRKSMRIGTLLIACGGGCNGLNLLAL
jgi:hypothetical protein